MTTNKPILKIVSFVYKCSFINICFSSRKNADTIRNNNEYNRNVTEYHTNLEKCIFTFKAIFNYAFKGVFIFSSRNLFKGFSRRHTDENAQKVFISNLRNVYIFSRLDNYYKVVGKHSRQGIKRQIVCFKRLGITNQF